MADVGSIKKVKLNLPFKYFGPESTVSEIADMMDLEDIGAVPVLNNQYLLLGLVSERDIVRKLVKAGRDSDLVTAKDIMTEDVISVQKKTPIIEALKIMRENNIRHLPVIDDNHKMINFISLRDLITNSQNKKINYVLLAFALILLPAILILK